MKWPRTIMGLAMSLTLLLFPACQKKAEVEKKPSLAEEYSKLADHHAEISLELETLRQKLARVDLERKEWKQRAGELEEELQRLTPERLPVYSSADMASNSIILSRVFSLRTGKCFDLRGLGCCLFAEISEEEGGGYVIYKANRVFENQEHTPALTDPYGNRLQLVTTAAARTIGAWEKADLSHSARMSAY